MPEFKMEIVAFLGQSRALFMLLLETKVSSSTVGCLTMYCRYNHISPSTVLVTLPFFFVFFFHKVPPFQPHLCVNIIFLCPFFFCVFCLLLHKLHKFLFVLNCEVATRFRAHQIWREHQFWKEGTVLGVKSKNSSNGWTMIWWTEDLYKHVMFAFGRSGAEKLGRICRKKNWNVYYELVLRLI